MSGNDNEIINIYSTKAENLCVDEYEVLRYLGYIRDVVSSDDIRLVQEYTEEIRDVFMPKACYGRFHIAIGEEGKIEMPYGTIESKMLADNLKGCEYIYIFAATIGPRFDMRLLRERAKSISKAAYIQTIGAAATEAFCNEINNKLRDDEMKKGNILHPRFSPGFGDFGLDNQKGIFSVLNPERNLGLTLRDTLIMAPEKSVTAVIGIESAK